MSNSTDILELLDYKILKCISKFDSVSKDRIVKKLKSIESINIRLEKLEEIKYIEQKGDYDNNVNSSDIFFVNHFIGNGIYNITPQGKKALQDFYVSLKQNRRAFSKNYWVAIIGAIIALGTLVWAVWSFFLLK